jgi:hypothetical protein
MTTARRPYQPELPLGPPVGRRRRPDPPAPQPRPVTLDLPDDGDTLGEILEALGRKPQAGGS